MRNRRGMGDDGSALAGFCCAFALEALVALAVWILWRMM